MPEVRVTLFRQSNFDFADLGLIIRSYSSSPSSCYIQARVIHLTESSTVSDKVKNRTRSLTVNIGIDRNTSVDYTVAWNQIT